MCPFASNAATANCTTSDLPRITFSTFACNAAMRSSERFNDTASLAIAYLDAQLRKPCRYSRASALVVIRPAATLRRHPRDDLVRVHDVARLAVEAVGEVEERDAAAAVGRRLRLVDVRGTEVQARVAVLLRAARDADLGVGDQQVRRLILLVQHAAVV